MKVTIEIRLAPQSAELSILTLETNDRSYIARGIGHDLLMDRGPGLLS